MYMQYDKHLQKTDMADANNVYSTANTLNIFRFSNSTFKGSVQMCKLAPPFFQLCLVRYYSSFHSQYFMEQLSGNI